MLPERIKAVLKEIISQIDHEECILFGSHAREKQTGHSDFDLLVIIRDKLSIREKMEKSSALRGAFAVRGIDADIILKSREEIEYYKDKTGHIVKNALAEGIPAW